MEKYGDGKGKGIKLVVAYLSQFEGILLIFRVFPSINDNNARVAIVIISIQHERNNIFCLFVFKCALFMLVCD